MKRKIFILISVVLIAFSFSGCDQNEYADYKAKGEAFLLLNKGNADVVTTSSGLQYKVLVNSSLVDHPVSGSSVLLNYTLSYYNNTVDNTINTTVFDEGTYTVFAVSGMITGMKEAVLKMKLGSKWRLYIPYDLAYGSDGYKDSTSGDYLVPPYSVIICDIEIVGIY